MFKKRSYSDLEVQEVLQTLFQEKKRVHDLELKLKNCTLAPPAPASSEQLDALKTELDGCKETIFKYREMESRFSAIAHEKEQMERKLRQIQSEASKIHERDAEKMQAIKLAQDELKNLKDQQPSIRRLVEEAKQSRELVEEKNLQLKKAEEALKSQATHIQQILAADAHKTEALRKAEEELQLLRENQGQVSDQVLKLQETQRLAFEQAHKLQKAEEELQLLRETQGQASEKILKLQESERLAEEQTRKLKKTEEELQLLRESLEQASRQLLHLQENQREAIEKTHKLQKSEAELKSLTARYESLIQSVSEDRSQWQQQSAQAEKQLLENFHQLEAEAKQSRECVADYQKAMLHAEEEILNLRQQLAMMKEQLKANPEHDPAVQRQKEQQLERVIQFMRKRAEGAELELNEQSKRASAADDAVQELKLELAQAKESQQKLSEALQQERRINSEISAEEQALKQQMEQLKAYGLQLQATLKGKDTEKVAVLKEMQEVREAYGNGQRELELLKQMMMKTLQEFKDERHKEEDRYRLELESLKALYEAERQRADTLERSSSELLNENQSHKEHKEKQLLLLAETQQALQALELAHHELTRFTEEQKSKHVKAEEAKKTLQESLAKKEEMYDSLNAQVANLARSLAEAEEHLQQTESERHEHEARFRVAQQHLAKKVRESTLLAEKNEEYKLRIADLESMLSAAKGKSVELQATLDAESVHQKKLQAQYEESIKGIEAQAAKWEEKYFQIHERWQDVEARNRELKRLEERFGKLQQVLGHLGSLLSTPLSLPNQNPEHESRMTAPDIEVGPPTPQCTTIQSSLFDTSSKTAPRYKETLFG